jgi:hypothetical protein
MGKHTQHLLKTWIGSNHVLLRAYTAVLGGTLLLCHQVLGQAPHTKEAIAKTWKVTQDRIATARFEWTERQTDAAGSLSFMLRLRNPKLEDVIPPKDTTFTKTCSLFFDTEAIRYSYKGAEWSHKVKRYEPMSYNSTSKGIVSKLYWEPSPHDENWWPQGRIAAKRENLDVSLASLQPILMTFRGMTPDMRAFDIETFTLTGNSAIIRGHECFALKQKLHDSETQLWVDPTRSYSIVRYLVFSRGVIQQKVDVRFELGELGMWIPTQWETIINLPDGNLRNSVETRLVKYELNSKIEKNEFELEFPPGTRVRDGIQMLDYIIRPDGSGKREIPRADIGATYEKMLSTEPGKARDRPNTESPGRLNWLAILGILTGLGCLILLVGRGRFQRRKGEIP